MIENITLNQSSSPYTDKPTMVLELMQAGDLQTFLIGKRATCDKELDNLYTSAESIEGALSSGV